MSYLILDIYLKTCDGTIPDRYSGISLLPDGFTFANILQRLDTTFQSDQDTSILDRGQTRHVLQCRTWAASND